MSSIKKKSKDNDELPKQGNAEQESAKSETHVSSAPYQEKATSMQVQPARSKNNSTRALLIILAAVVTVTGFIYIYPYFSAIFSQQQAVVSRIDQLMRTQSQLEEKLASIENSIGGYKADELVNPDKLQGIDDRIKELETRQDNFNVQALRGMQKKDEQLTKILQSLVERVSTLEQRAHVGQQQMARVPEVIRAFSILREAIQSTRPFEQELQNIIPFLDIEDAKTKRDLDIISKIAKDGAPSYSDLIEEFKSVAKEVRRASIPDDLPWYSKFVQRLRTLIIVRKDGTSLLGGSSVDEVLAKMNSELQEGDIDAVINLSDKLSFDKLDSFENWKQMLVMRHSVDTIMPILESYALEHLLNKNVTDLNQIKQNEE